MELLIGLVFWLGPGFLVLGLVLLFLMKVWPKMSGSPKMAAWMAVLGVLLCVADFLFILWLISAVAGS